MSDIKFEILYQARTIFVILKLQENIKNLYNKFIEQLNKELNIDDPNKKAIYKLMTLNTKEMYLIVNEDNFENIIKEKTTEGIIKLFLDIDFESNIDKKEEIKEIKKNDDDEEDFNETINLSNLNKINLNNQINIEEKKDFEEEKLDEQEEKIDNINDKENKIINLNNKENFNLINNDNQDINNNIINNDIIKEEEKNLIKVDNNKEVNKDTINNKNKADNENIINNDIMQDIKEDNSKIEQRLIKNDNDKINEQNQININEPKEIFETCNICKNIIKENIKYECCICDHNIICEKCEENHEHPCIKFKKDKSFLHTLKDCYSFITQKQSFDSLIPIKYIKNIFNNTYDLSIQLEIDDHIEFGKNQTIDIPFKIRNLSEYTVSSDDFIIILKNYSIVNISYNTKERFEIKPKNFITKILKCSSKDILGKETINMEIYSPKIKIRQNAFIKEDIEIIISDDEENYELNKKFMFYPNIQLLNKLRKKMLLYVIEKHFVDKSITQIYESLKNNKWDLDVTLNQLKSM